MNLLALESEGLKNVPDLVIKILFTLGNSVRHSVTKSSYSKNFWFLHGATTKAHSVWQTSRSHIKSLILNSICCFLASLNSKFYFFLSEEMHWKLPFVCNVAV